MCVWRWMRDARVMFPTPVKINNRNYWRVGDLRQWQAERVTKAAA
jgi:predicted DNA-binding transcriptional regulator AlpA